MNVVTICWNCVTFPASITISLKDKRNGKLLIMAKLNEEHSGAEKNNEVKGTHSNSWGDRYQNHPVKDPYSKIVFKCPVKCEGDKTYNRSGNCPVCNAVLEDVSELHEHYYL